MGRYTRTRKRLSNTTRTSSSGDSGETTASAGASELDSDEGGGSSDGGGYIIPPTMRESGRDSDTIFCCSGNNPGSTTGTTATCGVHGSSWKGNSYSDHDCHHEDHVTDADEALWTRSKKSTIIPQRKGQRPLQVCVGNCPNGPTTPPLSSSSSPASSTTHFTMSPLRTNCGERRGGGSRSNCNVSSSSSSHSHSSSRWKRNRRLFPCFFPNNFYHHSLRWDFFGRATVSFTLLCGSILILLGSRNDLLGQCVRGDEISEADKPSKYYFSQLDKS